MASDCAVFSSACAVVAGIHESISFSQCDLYRPNGLSPIPVGLCELCPRDKSQEECESAGSQVFYSLTGLSPMIVSGGKLSDAVVAGSTKNPLPSVQGACASACGSDTPIVNVYTMQKNDNAIVSCGCVSSDGTLTAPTSFSVQGFTSAVTIANPLLSSKGDRSVPSQRSSGFGALAQRVKMFFFEPTKALPSKVSNRKKVNFKAAVGGNGGVRKKNIFAAGADASVSATVAASTPTTHPGIVKVSNAPQNGGMARMRRGVGELMVAVMALALSTALFL